MGCFRCPQGQDRRKLQYAVLAAAALHGGAEPDLLAPGVGQDSWSAVRTGECQYPLRRLDAGAASAPAPWPSCGIPAGEHIAHELLRRLAYHLR